MYCDLDVEDMYSRADLMSRLRDLALNRLFFPPPNVFMTAANLITHFDQTIELVSKRIFQEPFREEELEMQKVMPVLQKQEVGRVVISSMYVYVFPGLDTRSKGGSNWVVLKKRSAFFFPLVCSTIQKHYWRPSVDDVLPSLVAEFRKKLAAAHELDEALRCKFRVDAELLGIKFG